MDNDRGDMPTVPVARKVESASISVKKSSGTPLVENNSR